MVVPSFSLSTIGSRALPVAVAQIIIQIVSASSVESLRHEIKNLSSDPSVDGTVLY